jgi:hypothetical protein
MNNPSSKSDINDAERAEMKEVAKAKLLDGTISSISIDTCIFTENGNRLSEGIIGHLEQFRDEKLQLVFSEITTREVHAHILKNIAEVIKNLQSALSKAKKYFAAEKIELIESDETLLDPESPKKIATHQVEDFVKRCGATIIEANASTDLSILLHRYFEGQPPFEVAGKKKSEFPDAIALLSLEAWAEKQNTALLFVTKDIGCLRYCSGSARLYAIDNLSEALELIQYRDDHCIKLSEHLLSVIHSDAHLELQEEIFSAVENQSHKILWDPFVYADYYYEIEPEDLEITTIYFIPIEESPTLRVIEYNASEIVVQVSVGLIVEATCTFEFSISDSIDKDTFPIGNSIKNVQDNIEVQVLLTFEIPMENTPQLLEVEVLPKVHSIDFGTVSPFDNQDSSQGDCYS